MSRFLTLTGLEPDFVAGHSYGELVALWRAGVSTPIHFRRFPRLAAVYG